MTDGSSMVQNQKLRRRTSLGRRSDGQAEDSVPEAEWLEDVVDAVDQHRHPPDAPFGHGHREVGEAQAALPTTTIPPPR